MRRTIGSTCHMAVTSYWRCLALHDTPASRSAKMCRAPGTSVAVTSGHMTSMTGMASATIVERRTSSRVPRRYSPVSKSSVCVGEPDGTKWTPLPSRALR